MRMQNCGWADSQRRASSPQLFPAQDAPVQLAAVDLEIEMRLLPRAGMRTSGPVM